MQVRVRLFAGLRERAGADELELELPEGALVGDALERMRALTEGVPVVMAVNREYADPESPLHGGDEVALIPPVSGGAVGTLHVGIVSESLSLDRLIELVTDPRAGAVVTFLGVTREVPALEYEAYAEMAVRQFGHIADEAGRRFNARVAIHHRIGPLEPGETSVVIAAAAPHRADAFDACRFAIEALKQDATIWKREVYPDGSTWVGLGS